MKVKEKVFLTGKSEKQMCGIASAKVITSPVRCPYCGWEAIIDTIRTGRDTHCTNCGAYHSFIPYLDSWGWRNPKPVS